MYKFIPKEQGRGDDGIEKPFKTSNCVTRNLWAHKQLLNLTLRVISEFIIVLASSLFC